jgi:virulence factor Mce-like protein
MKNRYTNETIAGVFVVIGLIGLVFMVISLGDVDLFSSGRYALYAQFQSVTGLRSGTPVEMNGVRVGKVAQIRLDHATHLAMVELKLPEDIVVYEDGAASIRTEGIIGDAYVTIAPGGKGRVLKPGETIKKTAYPFESFAETAQELPLKEIADKFSSTLSGIERLVNSGELSDAIHNLNQTFIVTQNFVRRLDKHVEPVMVELKDTEQSVQKLADHLDARIDPVLTGITAATVAARRALNQMERTLALKEGRPAALATSLKEAADAIRRVADATRPAVLQAEKTFANIRALTDRDSQEIFRINETLKELSAAARSVRNWAEYLERHPEALIRGKGDMRSR